MLQQKKLKLKKWASTKWVYFMRILVRPFAKTELERVVDYFLRLSPEDDARMCIDRKNLPARAAWIQLLVDDLQLTLIERQFCYLGIFLDDVLFGHCGINKIHHGQQASIHGHIWDPHFRHQAFGLECLHSAVRFYFDRFSLQKIIAEPNATNIAPNKLLLKAGFVLTGSYQTTPSPLNFAHQVNGYELTKEAWLASL